MSEAAPSFERMHALREAGRHDELLSLLRQSLAGVELDVAPHRTRFFITMFEWKLLAEHYMPARTALKTVREEQIAHLLAGELYVGKPDPRGRTETRERADRFLFIAEINDILADASSTYALFTRLAAERPELARRYAWRALPAMVGAGDFALADRYRQDPLKLLAEVNRAAKDWPLFPPPLHPRTSSELSNLVGDVRTGMDVLRGLGRAPEADALRAALLSGLDTGELREWAQRELEEAGSITRHFVARQMALEDQAPG